MAIISLDLGSSSQTLNSGNATTGDTVNVTALGTQTLTVDGVGVTLNSVAGITVGATPVFNLVNGASLTTNAGLLSAGVLGSTTYNINDTSSLTLGTPTAGLSALTPTTVNFIGGQAGSLIVANNALLGTPVSAITVNGYGTGDKIGFTNGNATFVSYASTGATSGTLVLSVPATLGTSTYTFDLANMSPAVAANLAVPGNAALSFSNGVLTAVCFLQGTMIATPGGEVAIEELAAGDQVIGSRGIRTVKWIGRRLIWTARLPEAHAIANLPIRLVRGALADNVPTRDLLVSPGHHLMLDGELVKASELVNGSSIFQDGSMARIEYFHLELDQFDTVISNGATSESWADGGNRDYFQNVDVTTLTPIQRQRRLAERPGFALMSAPAVVLQQQKLAERAVPDTAPLARVA